MSAFMRSSVRAYRALVLLYPAELRREFGAEMVEVFADDLHSARSFRGARGALAVWWCALKEFVRIGVPAHAENRIIAVPCILFCLNELFLGFELFLAFGFRIAPMAVVFTRAGLIPGLIAALTSVVVVIVGRKNPFCLLTLGPGACSKFTI